MKNRFKVATWNIGGAHTIKSANTFDYDKENLAYFAENLKDFDLDIVCLQESHTKEDDVVSNRLAELLGFPFVFDSPRSPSHIDEKYQLSNAIISRYPIEETRNVLLPDPFFELYFQDGRKARLFRTYIQIAKIQGINFANTHLQPLHIFGYAWSKGEGGQLASDTDKVFINNLSVPLVCMGDFNDPHLEKDFPGFIESFELKFALDDQPTQIKGEKVDYILYSPEFTVRKAEVIKTNKSDHYLCLAELEKVR